MKIVSIDDLNDFKVKEKSRIAWPEVDAMVKRIGVKDLLVIENKDILAKFKTKQPFTSAKGYIRKAAKKVGKAIGIMRTDDDDLLIFTQ